MKLEKAIEIKKAGRPRQGIQALRNYEEADRLLIEAGKAWEKYRDGKAPSNYFLLPGETED